MAGVAVDFVVVTVLPHERAAVELVLDDAMFGETSVGRIAGWTVAVVTLPDMGNSAAAATIASNLARHRPTQAAVFCGIAAGVPNPAKGEEHVRVGDVVLTNAQGVMEYDRGKRIDGKLTVLAGGHRPMARLVTAAMTLLAGELREARPWSKIRSERFSGDRWARPTNDNLLDENGKVVPHPADHRRVAGQPRVHVGRMAAGDAVVRDRELRGELLAADVRSIDMESAGLAAAGWVEEVPYYAIRGICDYADAHKADGWQLAAAADAACVLRALLESLDPTVPEAAPPSDDPHMIDPIIEEVSTRILGRITDLIAGAVRHRDGVRRVVADWQDRQRAVEAGMPIAWDAASGDPIVGEVYIPAVEDSEFEARFVEEAIGTLEVVQRAAVHIRVDLDLAERIPTAPAEMLHWTSFLRDALDNLEQAAVLWPQRKPGVPAPDDGTFFDEAIGYLRDAGIGVAAAVRGAVGAPPVAKWIEVPASDERSTSDQTQQRYDALRDLLLPFVRVDTRPFDPEIFNEAVRATIDHATVPEVRLGQHSMPSFAYLAARVAFNADSDERRRIVSELVTTEPLVVASELLRSMRAEWYQAGQEQQVSEIDAALRVLFATLETDLLRQQFWEDNTTYLGRALRVCVELRPETPVKELVARFGSESRESLCLVLRTLSSWVVVTSTRTGEERVEQQFNRHSSPLAIVDADLLLEAIDRFDATGVTPSDDCVRLGAEFRALAGKWPQ